MHLEDKWGASTVYVLEGNILNSADILDAACDRLLSSFECYYRIFFINLLCYFLGKMSYNFLKKSSIVLSFYQKLSNECDTVVGIQLLLHLSLRT